MYDVVEHLHPWELHQAMLEVGRVMKVDGPFSSFTRPRIVGTMPMPTPGCVACEPCWVQGDKYPKDPRAITPVNQEVHVNEQDILSMRRALNAAGFKGKIWLDSPPQNRDESGGDGGFAPFGL